MISEFRKYIKSPSGVVTCLAILLSIYFFYASQKKPQLTMHEVSEKTIVASPKDTSKLKLLYNGKEVDEEVLSTDIVVWNAGTGNIKKDMILEDVLISIEPPTSTIFEVRIIESTRDVIDFSVEEGQLQAGVIPISWKILESGDGAKIQVVHSNENSPKFIINGVVENQGDVLKYAGSFIERLFGSEISVSSSGYSKIGYFVLIVFGIFMIAPVGKDIKLAREKDYGAIMDLVVGTLGGVCFIIVGFSNIFSPILPF